MNPNQTKQNIAQKMQPQSGLRPQGGMTQMPYRPGIDPSGPTQGKAEAIRPGARPNMTNFGFQIGSSIGNVARGVNSGVNRVAEIAQKMNPLHAETAGAYYDPKLDDNAMAPFLGGNGYQTGTKVDPLGYSYVNNFHNNPKAYNFRDELPGGIEFSGELGAGMSPDANGFMIHAPYDAGIYNGPDRFKDSMTRPQSKYGETTNLRRSEFTDSEKKQITARILGNRYSSIPGNWDTSKVNFAIGTGAPSHGGGGRNDPRSGQPLFDVIGQPKP